MNLDQIPRRRYTSGPTPIEKMDRLSTLLGKGNLYIKRDDLTGLAGGGNKTRKLEYSLGRALAEGADTIITCGGLQSNHCRLTAAAAVREGLACHLILVEEPHQTFDPAAGGNNLLYHLLGVGQVTVIKSSDDPETAMHTAAEQVRLKGGSPFLIPVGASNPVGTLGYISCACEIIAQAHEMDIHFDYVVTASGSGGTQAGLVLGFHQCGYHTRVLGMNVSRSAPEQEELITTLAAAVIREFSLPVHSRDALISCFDKSVGQGYAVPSAEMVKAVRTVAAAEGILLDPVYTGKAMVGLFDLMQKDYFQRDDNILFIHTGGTPALYTCPELFIF